jgi:hypothetical protein
MALQTLPAGVILCTKGHNNQKKRQERGIVMHQVIGVAIGGGIAALFDLLQWLL